MKRDWKISSLKTSLSKAASRRDFLKWSGTAAASSALVGAARANVHVADDPTIRLALIGCGGRGSGAVKNAFSAPHGPVKLHAMADLFESRLNRSYQALNETFADQVDVSDERRFIGFNAYRHAIDCLRPGDIALLTAYSYCRPAHLEYAVEKGVNVFMEKPFAPDPVGLHRMLRAGELAEQKKLKIAAGLMCRHSVARQAMIEKIRNGELGDILLVRAYRMDGGGRRLDKWNSKGSELLWQIRNRIHFHWIGSGHFIEYLIHQIDECCWIKDACSVSAIGLGGRVPKDTSYGQNLDAYGIEYTFSDGTKALVDCRGIPRCDHDFSTFVHGTKRAGQFSGNIHHATVHTYKDQRENPNNIDWKAAEEPCTPWQAEWNVLLKKIRQDEPHNETKRAVYTDMTSIMGRAAAHTGKIVTWDEVMNSNFQFVPDVDSLTLASPTPLPADAEGYYPLPIPGEWTEI